MKLDSTTYYSSGQPNVLTFQNGDTDSFTYDPNTNRPTKTTTVFGSSTVTNQLTWNANGSLYQYVYTDAGTPAAPSQTCTYGADDLSRIASVSCVNGTTSELAQNFTYDPFGNIQKTVPSGGTGFSYSASYRTATNQVNGGITPAPVYDLNGNQKNLTATGESISWNALNQPISMNGITATYDALGRMVETGSGSSYQQFVFTPDGNPYAIYNAGTSTLIKGTVPLPGGDTAIYNQSGLSYLRHTDWLGSSRLATTWAHAVYSKTAYAPFGETYNEAGTADRSFTGQDQDVVSGSGGTGAYDFLFRKQDPSAGRWLSPDPYGWGAVDQTNPQTLNRYAYVVNNPIQLSDPNGLDCAYQTEGGYVMVNTGDCPTSGPGANGTYIDCDGCLYNASSGFIDPSTGTAYFMDSNGNIIDQDTIKGFADADPSFYTATVTATDDDGSVTLGSLAASIKAFIGPNVPNRPSLQQTMRLAAHWMCGKSPADRVAKSVLGGAKWGAAGGAVAGFVSGEVFGGEVTLGATGLLGAYAGAHVGAAVGAANGLTTGLILAGVCYAGMEYDSN